MYRQVAILQEEVRPFPCTRLVEQFVAGGVTAGCGAWERTNAKEHTSIALYEKTTLTQFPGHVGLAGLGTGESC